MLNFEDANIALGEAQETTLDQVRALDHILSISQPDGQVGSIESNLAGAQQLHNPSSVGLQRARDIGEQLHLADQLIDILLPEGDFGGATIYDCLRGCEIYLLFLVANLNADVRNAHRPIVAVDKRNIVYVSFAQV